MSPLAALVLLMEHSQRYRHMADRFRPGGNDSDFGTIVAIGLVGSLVLAAGVVIWLFERRWVKWKTKSRYHLFRELCSAHRLSMKQAWLIWYIARQCQLEHPVSLFINPEVLEDAIRQQKNPKQARQFQLLYQTLFKEDAASNNLSKKRPSPAH